MSIFKKFLSKSIDKSNNIIEKSSEYISIFDKDSFTLKELCNLFIVVFRNLQQPSVSPVASHLKQALLGSAELDFAGVFCKLQTPADPHLEQALLEAAEVSNIYECYMNFSSGNKKYRDFLVNTRSTRGLIIINNKNIYFREILQKFDTNFNKLVIRINTESSNYDITISWKEFEEKVKNLTKMELEELINNNANSIKN